MINPDCEVNPGSVRRSVCASAFVVTALLAFFMTVGTASAESDDGDSSKFRDFFSGVAGDTKVSVSPRFWYFLDGLAAGGVFGPNANQELFFDTDPFGVPMYGAAIAVQSSRFTPTTKYTFTVMYGTASEEAKTTSIAQGRGGSDILTQQFIDQDLKRLDIEFSSSTRLTDFASLILGFRYEKERIDLDRTFVFRNLDTDTTLPPVEEGTITTGYDLYSIRGGVSGVAPMTAGGGVRLYANVLAFAGRREEYNDRNSPLFDESWLMGPDLSTGITAAVTDSFDIDFRYRAIIFFDLLGDSFQTSDPKITHGPSIGFNIRF